MWLKFQDYIFVSPFFPLLQVIKGLGESDSDDDDASKWIERQKKKTKEKEEAEKRAKAMEQLDEEFGVGDIVDEGLKSKRQQEYSGRNLKGLRVEHSSEAFNARETVLTLKYALINLLSFSIIACNIYKQL